MILSTHLQTETKAKNQNYTYQSKIHIQMSSHVTHEINKIEIGLQHFLLLLQLCLG